MPQYLWPRWCTGSIRDCGSLEGGSIPPLGPISHFDLRLLRTIMTTIPIKPATNKTISIPIGL